MPDTGTAQTPTGGPLLASRWFWALVLAVLTFAVWSPLLGNQFTFDDVVVVVLNDRLRTWRMAWEVFFHPYNWAANPGTVGALGTYRPFELVSYVVDYKLFGLDAFGYHLTRLVLHVSVQLLVFVFLCRWLRHVRIAFAVAAIAALHPACAEAMKAPSDLFVALFGLGAMCLASSWFQDRRIRRAIPIGLLFLAALMAKESGLIYVLASLAFVEVERRRTEPRPPLSSLAPVAGAAALALAAYTVIRLNALGAQSVPQHGSLPRLLDAAAGVCYFATQAFFVPLNRAPAILDFTGPRPDRVIWYLVLALLGVVLAVLIRRRRTVEAVGLSWWLISLAPSAAVTLTPGVWPGLNRWLYLGAPGLLLAIVGILRPRLEGRAPKFAWAGLCVVMTVLAVRAGRIWRNDVTLFSAMVEESPDHFWSYRRLGWALYYRAQFSRAIPVLEKGAELAPADERDSCYGLLAAAIAGTGDCDAAVSLYRAHLPTPMMDLGHFLYVVGSCYERKGDVNRALDLVRACGTRDQRCPEAAERLTLPGGQAGAHLAIPL
jgi:protein O-mannosyl-transferase